MKNGIGTNPAYRRVVAALEDCEERYGGLIKSIGGTNDYISHPPLLRSGRSNFDGGDIGRITRNLIFVIQAPLPSSWGKLA
jgi:hypothetical protein